MNIEISDNLKNIKEGIFAELNELKDKLVNEGKELFNLFIGTPDFPVYKPSQDMIIEKCKDPNNFKYSLKDIPEMLEALKDYYKNRFGVDISVNDMMSVPGSQEGVSHITMAICNPGDLVLIPNPGYPAYEVSTLLSYTNPYYYDLLEKNDYLIDFDSIPEDISKKAKCMIVSYPYNPVCAVANDRFYNDLILYAKKYNIIIIHDNAYSDIIYDGNIGKSFLSYDGAMDVGVEFFSLSKSFNLTGARISYVLGNSKIISAYKLLRSQFDFGMFLPLQYGAIEALKAPREYTLNQCREYQKRRDILVDGLNSIGWPIKKRPGTMFVWAKIPCGYKTSREFCLELLKRTGVLCTPGEAFGSLGEGYVRFALVLDESTLKKAIISIKNSNILNK